MTGKVVCDSPGTLVMFQGKNKSKVKGAVLLLHGFPGKKNKQNRDIAVSLCNYMGFDCYILHYSGLGKAASRPFSFKNTIEEAFSSYKLILNKKAYSEVHIIGHSWGGLVALNLVNKIKKINGKTILLSPLMVFPGKIAMQKVIKQYFYKNIKFKHKKIEKVYSEIESLRKYNEPKKFITSLSRKKIKLHFIQARNDFEVDRAENKKILTKTTFRNKYHELNQGHHFLEDRKELIECIKGILQ